MNNYDKMLSLRLRTDKRSFQFYILKAAYYSGNTINNPSSCAVHNYIYFRIFSCIEDEMIPVGKIKGLGKRRGVSVSYDFQTYEVFVHTCNFREATKQFFFCNDVSIRHREKPFERIGGWTSTHLILYLLRIITF